MRAAPGKEASLRPRNLYILSASLHHPCFPVSLRQCSSSESKFSFCLLFSFIPNVVFVEKGGGGGGRGERERGREREREGERETDRQTDRGETERGGEREGGGDMLTQTRKVVDTI